MDEHGTLYKQKQREELKITHEELELDHTLQRQEMPPEEFRQERQTTQQPAENYFPMTARAEMENRLQQPTKDQKVRRAFDAAQDQVFSKNTTIFYDGSAKREINEQIQKHKDLHSEKLLETITLARRLTGLEPVTMNSLSYLPSATVLHSEYKAKDLKLTAKKRAEKLENKRSRLYQKRVVAGQILQAEANNIAAGLQMMEMAIGKDQVLDNDQEIMDLAAFMTTDKTTNERMVKAFFGTGGDPRTVNREAVLDGMTQMLFTINIGSLRLDNDQEMAKNAPMLEMVVRQVDAFDRLAKENNYLEGLNERMRSDVELKLSQLRSIAFYYNARKEILSDPYYMSHYNEELTMDITKEPTAAEKKDVEALEQRKAMSEKLLKAYVAGRVMMEKNGVDSDLIRKMGVPTFADKAVGEQFVNYYMEEFQKEDVQKNALAESYQTKMKQQVAFDELSKVRGKAADTSFRDELYSEVIKNATEYQGEYCMKEGYKDPEYSEQKMAEYLQELNETQATQVSYSSIASLVRDFNKNHELCARVKFLHKQICRGIASGYPMEDKQLLSIRAKTNFFALVDLTGCLVNTALIRDKNKAFFSNEQWEDYLKKSVHTGRDDAVKLFGGDLFGVLGDPMALYSNCERYAKQEDATKDETIERVWQSLVKIEEGEKVPKEDLERMRAEYNKTAVLDDFFFYFSFTTTQDRNASTLIMAKLEAEEAERAKREHRAIVQPLRPDSAFCHYLSADDIEKSHELWSSKNPLDKIKHYSRVITEAKQFSFDELDVSNLPKLLENFEQKERTVRLQMDNVLQAAKLVDEAANKLDNVHTEEDKIHLSGAPLDYYDRAQMLRDCNVLFDFSCGYLAGRINTLTQMDDTKYQHVLSFKDRMSLKDEDFRKYQKRQKKLEDEQNETEESMAIEKILNKYKDFLCMEQKTDDGKSTGHHYRPGEESLDYLYREERRRVDQKLNYWEKQDAYYDQWDRDFQEAVVPGYLEEQKEHIKESAGDIMAVRDYYKERTKKAVLENGLKDSTERRWAQAFAGTLVYFSEQDPKLERLDMNRTIKALCAVGKTLSEDEELHREKNRLLDQALDIFLNLDMKELAFADYHDFLKFDKTKYSMITNMAFEVLPSTMLRTYIEDLSGDNAEEFCTHTKEDIKEVLIRRDFIQNYNIFYNILLPFLTTENAKNIDVFELLEENQDEALGDLDEMVKAGKITNTEYGQLGYLVTGLDTFKKEDRIGPGADTDAAFKNYRKKNWDKPIYNLK